MKIYSALILSIFLLTACDKIDHPLQNYVPPETPQRKVLLEDYTGHQCGNCPAAAEVAKSLEEKYGEKLVTIAVHAGFFSKTNSKYPTSYTTTAGNDWNDFFLGPSAGYPIGMINRKNYADNGLIASHSKWSTVADLGFNDDYILDLDISPVYNSATRNLDVNVIAKFRQAYNSDIMVSVVLTEDSVIGPQTDYRIDPDRIEKYVFMHMLRASLNGSWGTELKKAPAKAQDSVSVSFNNFSVDAAFKAKNISIVAFAFNKVSREVLEAEKVKLTDNSDDL